MPGERTIWETITRSAPLITKVPLFGHKRKIPHKDFLLFNLLCLFIAQPHPYLKRRGIGSVPLLALCQQSTLAFHLLYSRETSVRGCRCSSVMAPTSAEHAAKPFVQKPLVRLLLHLNEVGHLQDFIKFLEKLLRDFYGRSECPSSFASLRFFCSVLSRYARMQLSYSSHRCLPFQPMFVKV